MISLVDGEPIRCCRKGARKCVSKLIHPRVFYALPLSKLRPHCATHRQNKGEGVKSTTYPAAHYSKLGFTATADLPFA